jgi:hypothetical protein
MTMPVITPALSLLFHFDVTIGAPVEIAGPPAPRRLIPITGGSVSGLYSGRIVPGGGDWQSGVPDDHLELSAHYIVEIDGHGLVEVQSIGVRNGPPEVLRAMMRGEPVDPSLYYFRTAIRLRTGAPGLARLNRILCCGVGTRTPDRAILDIFELG